MQVTAFLSVIGTAFAATAKQQWFTGTNCTVPSRSTSDQYDGQCVGDSFYEPDTVAGFINIGQLGDCYIMNNDQSRILTECNSPLRDRDMYEGLPFIDWYPDGCDSSFHKRGLAASSFWSGVGSPPSRVNCTSQRIEVVIGGETHMIPAWDGGDCYDLIGPRGGALKFLFCHQVPSGTGKLRNSDDVVDHRDHHGEDEEIDHPLWDAVKEKHVVGQVPFRLLLAGAFVVIVVLFFKPPSRPSKQRSSGVEGAYDV